MPTSLRAWLFALFSIAWLPLTGCDESRFGLEKKERAMPANISQRLRTRPPMAAKAKRPSTRPKLPASLRLESKASHAAAIRSLAVDPSGLFALSGGADRQLILWDLKRQKKIRSWQEFTRNIQYLQFSADGRRFLLLEGSNRLSMWSLQGQRLQRKTLPQPAHSVRFSPFGNQILTTHPSGAVQFLSSTTLSVVRQRQVCPKGVSARRIVVDPMQRWLLVRCANATFVMQSWDGKLSKATAHRGAIQSMALSPKGNWLATSSQDTQLSLWQVDSKQLSLQKRHVARGHLQPITAIHFHPTAPQFATASRDNTAGIWSLSPSKLSLLRYIKHSNSVESLAYIPGSKRQLLTGDSKGYLQKWTDTGHEMMRKSPPPWKARTLSFALRKDWLASDTSGNGSAVWDLKTGQQIMSMKLHPFPVRHIQFARSGHRMMSADRRNIVFWDLQRRRPIGVINPPKQTYLTVATLGRDWTQVFYGMDKGGVDLWTLAGPRRLYRDRIPQCVSAVAFHPTQKRAAAGTCEGKLYLYDFRSNKASQFKMFKRFKVESNPIRRLRFSTSGEKLLVLSTQQATIWSIPHLKKVASTKHSHALLAGSFLPKSETQLVLGSADRSIYLWNTGTNQLRNLLSGCKSPIRRLEFSPRKQLLASACFDGTIKLWRWKPATLLATLVGLPKQQWLTFTPEMFFVSSSDARRYFFFTERHKHWPIESFQGWFLSPKTLQNRLRLVSNRSKW